MHLKLVGINNMTQDKINLTLFGIALVLIVVAVVLTHISKPILSTIN
jgi:hypothetical protein